MNVTYRTHNRYRRHKEKWHDCQRCLLYEARSRVCIGRGRLPCDCLFIGEAPGQVENVRGEPFVGPAGRLLDSWIAEVDVKFTWAVTNMVGCAPFDRIQPGELNQPTGLEIAACLPRLNELVRIANPRVVVLLGRVATKHFKYPIGFYTPILDLIHPAHTLRVGGFGSQESREQIELLNEFLKEQLHGKK